jgi:outer membrane protein assembly factor BamB
MRMGELAMIDRTLVAAALLAMLASAATAGEPATSAATQPVSEQVKKLGDQSYKVREQAQKDLIQLGLPAKEEVAKAAQSEDAEVQSRASAILVEIAKNSLKANSDAIAGKVQWSFKLENVVAGPVLVEGLLWVLGGDGKLSGVDPATGQKTSGAELPLTMAPIPTPGSGNSCLVAAGAKVLINDAKGALYAVEGKSGKIAWKFEPPPADSPSPGPPGKGPASAPVPAARTPFRMGLGPMLAANDDLAVFWNDGTLTGLSVKDGQKLWDGAAANAVCPPSVGGGMVFLMCADANASLELMAFDAAGGKLLWKTAADSGNCPLYHDGMVMLASGSQIRALEAKEGKLQWQKTVGEGGGQRQAAGIAGVIAVNGRVIRMGRAMLQLAARDGIVYASDGESIAAMRVNDGTSVWAGKFPSGEENTDAADGSGAANGQIIINNKAGAVQIIGNRVLVRGGRLGAGVDDAVLVGEGAVYAPNADAIYAFDLKNGTPIWSFKTGLYVAGRPLLQGGMLYFVTGGAVPAGAISPIGVQVNSPASTGEKPKADAKPPLSAGLHVLKVN